MINLDSRKLIPFILFGLLILIVACTPTEASLEESFQPGQASGLSDQVQEGDDTEIVGQVDVITKVSWTIDGQKILVDDGTEIDENIAVGDEVKVEIRAGDVDQLVALEIVLFQSDLENDLLNDNEDELNDNGDFDENDDLNENDDMNENDIDDDQDEDDDIFDFDDDFDDDDDMNENGDDHDDFDDDDDMNENGDDHDDFDDDDVNENHDDDDNVNDNHDDGDDNDGDDDHDDNQDNDDHDDDDHDDDDHDDDDD